MDRAKKSAKQPKTLKKFDLEVEHFIQSYLVRESISPPQRTIAEHFGKSLCSIQNSLKKLKDLGRMEENTVHGRRLIPTPPHTPDRLQSVSLLGMVAAGQPIEAVEDSQSIEVPKWMMKPNTSYFVLRVKGQSMIEDSIQDGDFVLIRHAETARTGETVVALINNEATLKKLDKTSGRIRLLPANSSMAPIEVGAHQEFRIAGIFAGVLRKVD